MNQHITAPAPLTPSYDQSIINQPCDQPCDQPLEQPQPHEQSIEPNEVKQSQPTTMPNLVNPIFDTAEQLQQWSAAQFQAVVDLNNDDKLFLVSGDCMLACLLA